MLALKGIWMKFIYEIKSTIYAQAANAIISFPPRTIELWVTKPQGAIVIQRARARSATRIINGTVFAI